MKEKIIKLFEENRPQTQMTEEEMMTMMNIMMSSDPELKKPINELDEESYLYNHFKPLFEEFLVKVFFSKLENLTTLKITLGAFICLVQHFESLGDCVMYIFYMHYKLPPNTVIGINEISTQLFPWGFFSKEQLRNIWEKQKVKREDYKDFQCIGASDNLMDYLKVWE